MIMKLIMTRNKNTVVVDDEEASSSSISAVHPDIIQTHILTRLDGPTLASASCASSELHALTEIDRLWKNISSSTWPSTNSPRIQHIISTFPSGHRSFFSDAYPIIHHVSTATCRPNNKLISAVDIYYKNIVILSKVAEFESDTHWFRCTPFRVDLLDPKESVPINIPLELDLNHLRLSWILIDPTLKRAANLSSFRPVSVQRHWLSGDLQVRFGSVVSNKEEDYYYCGILVTCGEAAGKMMEVSMQVEDLDGRMLNGEDSMVILQGIVEREKKGEQNRNMDWVEMKRERGEKRERRERNLDMLCMSLGFAIFIAFCSSFLLLRRY